MMQIAYRSAYRKPTAAGDGGAAVPHSGSAAPRRASLALALVTAVARLLDATQVFAQTPANVAVVINDASPVSQRVGEYYVKARNIPSTHVIRIKTTSDEAIERGVFVSTIQEPVAAALARGQIQDRVIFLVLTKGIPLRIRGTTGPDGTQASVDSELTLLYRRMVGDTVLTRGRIPNPYYAGGREPRVTPAFGRRDHDLFLVSRLDGFTEADAIGLVDRAGKPSREGRIALDQWTSASGRVGDEWLAGAAQRLSAAGQAERVLIDATSESVQTDQPLLGLYWWGTTDPAHRTRDTKLRFVPGALAATFVSTDARTFRAPPDTWTPMTKVAGAAFEGSPHGLMGDLIRQGVTGVAGHIDEPQLQSVIRPDVLFEAYLSGRTLVEAFYLAMPHLSWQTVVVGDPLCAPFANDAPVDSDPGMDAATELPAQFAARRKTLLARAAPDLTPDAVAAWVRATALVARGEREAAPAAYERAVALAPRVVGVRLELAMLHQTLGGVDAAIAQYEQILQIQPNHVVSLNNLAYALAVDRGKPADGLPLARRAVALAPTAATILDTLGWIEHLMGDDAAAAKRLAEAIRRDPSHADIRLHAAVVYGALGVRGLAENELKEALRLEPSLEGSDTVVQLRARLSALPQ